MEDVTTLLPTSPHSVSTSRESDIRDQLLPKVSLCEAKSSTDLDTTMTEGGSKRETGPCSQVPWVK